MPTLTRKSTIGWRKQAVTLADYINVCGTPEEGDKDQRV